MSYTFYSWCHRCSWVVRPLVTIPGLCIIFCLELTWKKICHIFSANWTMFFVVLAWVTVHLWSHLSNEQSLILDIYCFYHSCRYPSLAPLTEGCHVSAAVFTFYRSSCVALIWVNYHVLNFYFPFVSFNVIKLHHEMKCFRVQIVNIKHILNKFMWFVYPKMQ